MNEWFFSEGNKCSVCFAGAVMAETLKVKPNEDLQENFYTTIFSPGDFVESEQLYALNHLRAGHIYDAFITLNLDFPNNFIKDVKIVNYHKNKKLFKKQMKELANALKKHGY